MFEVRTKSIKSAAAEQLRIAGAIRRDAYRTEYILRSLRADRQVTALVAEALDRVADQLVRQSQAVTRYAQAASRISRMYEEAESRTAGCQIILPMGWITYQRINLTTVIGNIQKIGSIRM